MEPNQNSNTVQNTASASTVDNVPNASSAPLAASDASVGSSKSGSDVIFRDKPKKSHGMIYGMILLAILAAGGIGFGVWAMMDGNSQVARKDEEISVLKSQNSELQEKISNSTNDGADINIDIDTDSADSSDSWDKFSRNLAAQSIYIMGYYSHYNGTSNEQYVAYAMKNPDGHLVVTDAGNNMSTDNPVLLELDNVLSVYYIKVGNGGVPYFYIVDSNGSVSRISISEYSDRQLEKVGEYTKIATVLEAASSEAILIDIDGNIYKSY